MERKTFTKSILMLSCLIMSCLTVCDIRAQEFDKVKIKATKVTPSIYMLEGMGGNIGVCIGEDATLIIVAHLFPLETTCTFFAFVFAAALNAFVTWVLLVPDTRKKPP